MILPGSLHCVPAKSAGTPVGMTSCVVGRRGFGRAFFASSDRETLRDVLSEVRAALFFTTEGTEDHGGSGEFWVGERPRVKECKSRGVSG